MITRYPFEKKAHRIVRPSVFTLDVTENHVSVDDHNIRTAMPNAIRVFIALNEQLEADQREKSSLLVFAGIDALLVS